MEIIIHRVNQRVQLRNIPPAYGVEIDLRAEGSAIILNHDPFHGGEPLEAWLEDYRHGLLVMNIKEAGIESEAIRLAELRGVGRFFLLDVEFPYIYRATRRGERRIAMRFSEDECLETVQNYRGKAEWVWIDTITRLPLDERSREHLDGFKSCLVCPERWGRPEDIQPYRRRLAELRFDLDAVMTSLTHAEAWSVPIG